MNADEVQAKRERIAAILKERPAISTNAIVRQVGCSWDFAQKTRHELGCDAPYRETSDGRLYPTSGQCPAGSAAKRRQVTAESVAALKEAARQLGGYPRTPARLRKVRRALAAFHAASKSPVPFRELWAALLREWRAARP